MGSVHWVGNNRIVAEEEESFGKQLNTKGGVAKVICIGSETTKMAGNGVEARSRRTKRKRKVKQLVEFVHQALLPCEWVSNPEVLQSTHDPRCDRGYIDSRAGRCVIILTLSWGLYSCAIVYFRGEPVFRYHPGYL